VRDRIDGLLRELPDKERQTWLRHKRTLEGAVITTIHGLCSRLLHEFPVEANIDPQFVLLDEHQAAMMLEAVVEEALAEAIHKDEEIILQFTQGTGRAAFVNALVELHRRYRGEGLSIDQIERLTVANHASEIDYFRALKELDGYVAQLLSANRLTPAAEVKRAKAAQEWPGLRSIADLSYKTSSRKRRWSLMAFEQSLILRHVVPTLGRHIGILLEILCGFCNVYKVCLARGLDMT